MAVQLNHTIVYCRDNKASASYLAELFGLPEPVPFGPFFCVDVANGVSLDYHETDGAIDSQHYAFLVSENDFTEIFGRIQERGYDYWADPMMARKGEINHNDGGRGVYWFDPDGHFLEIITRPYGSGGG